MVYDRLGRVTSETSAGVTHSSTWDKGGNRLTVTYGGTGRVLTSTYDKLQRLETLSEKLPSETTPRLTSYAYDKNGNVTGKTHPNGTAESTSYDALNRRMVHQVTVGSTVLSSFTFSHDKLSNVAQIIETYDASAGIAGRTVTNTYDKTRRLHVETAAEPGKTVATTYGYDKANNRTSKVVATTPTGGSTTTETHGYIYGNTTNGLNSNQVWKWIKPNGGGEVVYSYDANGNRATRTETVGGVPKIDTYTWDHWNRLTNLALQSKASAVNGTYAYGYDHRTRRIVRDESAISGRTRDLVIFSGGTSVQEHEGETGATPADEATPDMEYIRGSDWGGGVGGILYTSRAGVVSWAHYNGRGDVVTRTSDTGSLTYAASYEAFGTRTQEAGTNPDRQRANTKEEDPTGLLNEGHRYRDLELGMFISRDPAGFVDGPNVYTYVVQNPWSSFDPEGLEQFPNSTINGMKAVDTFLMNRDRPPVFGDTPPPTPFVRAVVLQTYGEENFDLVKAPAYKDVTNFGQDMLTIGESVPIDIFPQLGAGAAPTLLPESSVGPGASDLQKIKANLSDPTLRDLGPASIKVRSALEAHGYNLSKITNEDVRRISESISGVEGTAGTLRAMAEMAQKDVGPLIGGLSAREQRQVVVEYLREGRDFFWKRRLASRGLNDEQLDQWKKSPKEFVDAKGNRPAPITPDPIDEDQHKQVEDILNENP